jgi:hypothetical protein
MFKKMAEEEQDESVATREDGGSNGLQEVSANQ